MNSSIIKSKNSDRNLHPKMKWYWLICLLLFAIVMSSAHAKPSLLMHDGIALTSGDLIFLDLDCGDLCNAIEAVTKLQFHVDGPNLSHVGLLSAEPDGWFVYEAWQRVQRTPWLEFIARIHHADQWRAGRVALPVKTREAAIQFARLQLGATYDDDFLKDNQRYYCSELIADSFAAAAQTEIFPYQPMTFGESKGAGDVVWKIWRNYFKQRHQSVPVGKPGVSPLGIYLSPQLMHLK